MRRIATLMLMGLFSLTSNTLSQNTFLRWWAFDAGFGVPSSSQTAVKSAMGQSFVGTAQLGNTRIASGFLADTLLQGPVVGVNEEVQRPLTFALRQNYPNPFNPVTTITFDIPYPTSIVLRLFDILGREVTTLVNEEKPAGTYAERWDASGVSSGVYFYTLRAGSFVQTRKLMVVR